MIAGVDEVGRGCLSGPVLSAAVIFNKKIDISNIKDSKIMSSDMRKKIFKYLIKNSIYAVGTASVKEIEKINILNASLLAMERAIYKLKIKPRLVLIDGIYAPKNLKFKSKTIINGDEKIPIISAASIIAKVTRDNFMIKLSKNYPGYDWKNNFGYGTSRHLKALKKYGVTKHHRKKFKPVYNILFPKKRETQ